MKIVHHTLRIETDASTNIYDITPRLRKLIADEAIRDGWAIVTSQHTTAAVTINENEPRLLQDVQQFFARLVPKEADYLHNDIGARGMPDEPRNAHSHIAAMLLGASTTIGIARGRLALGQYQSVLFVELDGPRSRQVQVEIAGLAPETGAV